MEEILEEVVEEIVLEADEILEEEKVILEEGEKKEIFQEEKQEAEK